MNSIGIEAPSIFIMIWIVIPFIFMQAYQGIDMCIVDNCLLLNLGCQFDYHTLILEDKINLYTIALGFSVSCSSFSLIKTFPFFFLHVPVSFTTISHLNSFIHHSTNFSAFFYPLSSSTTIERWFAFAIFLADITALPLTQSISKSPFSPAFISFLMHLVFHTW